MPIRVFVDQGHNPYGFNAGAEGFGLREQDITYLVGTYLANILNADPRFEAITSRQTPDQILGYDTNSSLRARTDAANAYVYRADSPSYYLGEAVVAEIVRRLNTKNNGVYVRPSLYVLRRTNMPSVLVELAYISNEEDAYLLANEPYQFAYAIYVGLLNYLGLSQIL